MTQGYDISGATDLRFYTALKIRFLLDADVERFLYNLVTYLRRVKTEVSRERDFVKGYVKGRIDWKRTIQKWSSTNFIDKTSIAISRSIRNYDIPENLLLKKTITIVKGIMDDTEVEIEIEKRTFDWSIRLLRSRNNIRDILKNVHFSRISDINLNKITSRMIDITRKSRKQMYRDSLRIFTKYDQIFLKYDQTELEKLLKYTFIDPVNLEKTYEIFCLFTVIKIFESKMGWHVANISEITQERRETAILQKGEYTINIYYNVTTTTKFRDQTEPKAIRDALKAITTAYYGRSREVTTRRPDIILELLHNETVIDYLLLEIKFTTDDDYIVEGINQVLHYLYDLTVIKEKSENRFFQHLGKGYNAAVICDEYHPSGNTRVNLDDRQLKVKIFDFHDMIEETMLCVFFNHFFKSHKILCKKSQ